MELRKVSRRKARIRLGLSAVAGGGKSYSAILIAKGLAGDLSKVAIIDTENGSADLYAHLGEYNVLPLVAPFTPEKYIEAIHACEKAGMEVIIIDSITHEWDGVGGCLSIVESLGGKYQDWKTVTPRHNKFVGAILESPCHVITTVRRKQDYELIKENNKVIVQKAGLKEITREGFEYELTVNLEMDTTHHAVPSKDRTELFEVSKPFIPSEDTGRLLRDWCETGVEDFEARKREDFKSDLGKIKSLSSLTTFYNANKASVDSTIWMLDMIKERKAAIVEATKKHPLTTEEVTPEKPVEKPAPEDEKPGK